jgi:hypothetical protein
MNKFFNTAGPVNQDNVYKIDPLTRWDLDEILNLIEKKKYFILHAPRQTGKTSCLLALRDYLNAAGNYCAVYVNVEAAQAWREDIKTANNTIVDEIQSRLSDLNVSTEITDEILKIKKETDGGISTVLAYISSAMNRPVVLLIDEIDSLIGDSLISVLRQIRAGYDKRPANFPSTIILCGVRDIQDYRIHTSGKDIITGGSAFNIKAVSLRLGNFSKADVIKLYSQHTTETGQRFEEACYDLIMEYTDGQPWLVNALANEVTHEMKENRDRSVVITAQLLEEAKERLIISRQTHLLQLADKLEENRVRRIILPMILGESTDHDKDDVEYCIDLGLIKKTKAGLEISNGIYREIIPRELTSIAQDGYFYGMDVDWINENGSINVHNLLTQFKIFWFENEGTLKSGIKGYTEAIPHIITQAFLQRIINGGGTISREYGLGKKRLDLMIKWKYTDKGQHKYQTIIIEIKTINKKLKYETVIEKALKQTANYAKICGEKQAHILLFDKDNHLNWQETDMNEITHYNEVQVEIWKFACNRENE